MKKSTNAIILIYAIILSFLVGVLILIISNKQSIFIDNLNYNYYDSTMLKNIYNKSNITSKEFVSDSTGTYNKIKGYIKTYTGFNNIFWSNKDINDFIDGSSYIGTTKMGNTQTGIIYLDINNSYKLKFVEFDKNSYDSKKGLKYLSGFTFSSSVGSIGYLTSNGLVSSGVLATKYDFKSKDYAIFLSYTSSGAHHPEFDYLTYSIKIYDEYGSGVYINPIKIDSGLTRYLGYDIIFSEGNYISKILKLTK